MERQYRLQSFAVMIQCYINILMQLDIIQM